MRSVALWHSGSLLLATLAGQLAAAGADKSAPQAEASLIGRAIDDFALQDFRGKQHALADYADKQAVVVYFLGTECPIAKLYGPRVQKLADQFGPRGVAFVGVSSNVQDSLAELAAHARTHEISFPILKDLGNKVADKFGATRTPQVFVLDRERKVRYAGRVDAQFTFGTGVGLAQPQEQRADLAIALDELLPARKSPCHSPRPRAASSAAPAKHKRDSTVTYSNQIARLIQNRCLECHREGQIAPFALSDYEEVAGWGEMIAEVVREERMPPWHANPQYGHFANENRLSADEKKLIADWVASGCPQGDASDLPEPRRIPRRLVPAARAGPGCLHDRKTGGREGRRGRVVSPLHGRSGLHRRQVGQAGRVHARQSGRGAPHHRVHSSRPVGKPRGPEALDGDDARTSSFWPASPRARGLSFRLRAGPKKFPPARNSFSRCTTRRSARRSRTAAASA